MLLYSLPYFASFLAAGCCDAQSYIIGTVAGGLYTVPSAPSDVAGPATAAQLNGPIGLALDSAGNLYIADTYNHRIRKVSPQGTLTTFAGTGGASNQCADDGRYSGDGGPAVTAVLNCPQAVAVDQAGVVYIADTGNHVIRKVTPDGIISTFAGKGKPGYSGDGGEASNAQFTPSALAIDTASNLFIADSRASVVRKISLNGVITTFAGTGVKGYTGDGGPAINASITNPAGLALDKGGNLFIADSGNNVVRKVSLGGSISTVAGSRGYAYDGDGGPATAASFQNPAAVAVDVDGNLFIADVNSNRVRQVRTDGIIVTAAGNGNYVYQGDGGLATNAGIQSPLGLLGVGSSVYVADFGHNLIRLLTPGAPTSGAAPSISKGGIVPIASKSQTISAGSWISIYGVNLASNATPVVWNGDYPLTLGGTTVMIGGVPAPLSYVSPIQVNAYVPNTGGSGGAVTVSVTTANGTATSTATLDLVSPAFSLLGDGVHIAAIIVRTNGSGAFGNGSYDLIGPPGSAFGYPTVPAQAGDNIVLFGVGFGPTNPPATIPLSGTTRATFAVSVTIGNIVVTPSFVGLSSPGLFQFNLVLPAGLGSGDVPLAATVRGSSTQNNVLISVR